MLLNQLGQSTYSPIFFSGPMRDDLVKDFNDTETFRLCRNEPFSRFPYIAGFKGLLSNPVRSSEVFVAGINGAKIGTERYVVVGKDDRIVGETIPTSIRRQLKPGQFSDSEAFVQQTRRLEASLDGPRIAHLSGVVALLAQANNNYAHWHMDVLSSLVLLQELNLDTKINLLTSELKSYRRRSLEVLGVDFNRVHQIPSEQLASRHVTCDRLLVPSILAVHYGHIPFWQQRVFDRISSLILREHGNGAGRFAKYLYVDRSNDAKRRCRNEAELIGRLIPLGFKVIDPRDMEYDEEVLTYANADVIVGCMGAGLMNVLFARRGSTLVELKPPKHHKTNLWKTCAELAGCHHHSILYEDDGADPDGDSWGIPDVDATVAEIRRFL